MSAAVKSSVRESNESTSEANRASVKKTGRKTTKAVENTLPTVNVLPSTQNGNDSPVNEKTNKKKISKNDSEEQKLHVSKEVEAPKVSSAKRTKTSAKSSASGDSEITDVEPQSDGEVKSPGSKEEFLEIIAAEKETNKDFFENIKREIGEEMDKISEMSENSELSTVKIVKFLRSLNKKLTKFEIVNNKILNKKFKTKRKSSPSGGFNKILEIHPKLSEFLGVKQDQEVSRVFVNKYIANYLKENRLTNPSDNRKIIPDEKISNLLEFCFDNFPVPEKDRDLLTNGTLNFFNIQKILKFLYSKTYATHNKLSEFLDIPSDKKVSKVYVEKFVSKYVKDNHLGKGRVVTPDDKLSSLIEFVIDNYAVSKEENAMCLNGNLNATALQNIIRHLVNEEK